MKTVYLDNAATTEIDKKVLSVMEKCLKENYGNPSSQYNVGFEAKKILDDSRKIIAESIGANINEVVFTSGGTESNNFALKGLFFQNYPKKNHIITTTVEHKSVLKTCEWLESQGAKITYLEVDKDGYINLDALKNAINEKTFLVSVIHGNNEVGTIHDLKSIGEICKEKKVLFHSDACQSFMKVDIDVEKMNLDLLTINSHKIHGPKGVGMLYIKDGLKIVQMIHGGGHENNLRSGTENVCGILGFAEAVKSSKKSDVEKMKEIKNYLIEELLKIKNVDLNGPTERLCNNVNISFNNIEGEAISGYLNEDDICVSTGSACTSHSLKTSHVLKAIGLKPLRANSSVRISLSKYTTKDEVDYFLEKIKSVVEKLRRISPLVQSKEKRIKKIIKDAYSEIVSKKCSCQCGCASNSNKIAEEIGYAKEDIEKYSDANLGLGCGNPIALSKISEGETVLDLGSGAGFDAFLASRKVGENGKVIGVDMTEKMTEKANENKKKYGYENVEFKLGYIEDLPVENESVDVVISNCVINLSPDKDKVFSEANRVLKKSGKIYVSDIVLLEELSEEQKKDERLLYGCVAGALQKEDYINKIKKAGFNVKILGEDKEISKKQYAGINLESLKLEGIKK